MPELAEQARKTLADLGYSQIEIRQGDGWLGWPEEAPFDAILVTAASPRIPEKLLAQLGSHGRMVIPVEGDKADRERLMVIERDGEAYHTRDLGPVRFVPLLGQARSDEVPSSVGGFFEDLFKPKREKKSSETKQ